MDCVRCVPTFLCSALVSDLAQGYDFLSNMHCFLLTALFPPVQVIGYGTRVFSHYHTNQVAPYAVQSSFILLAPVLYAASIYMVLGRLVRSMHGERFSIVRPTRMTKLFVFGDVLALNVQGNGAGLTANEKYRQLGEYLVIAGLFVQLIVFGFFVVAALVFHMRMRRDIAKESESRPNFSPNIPWRQGLKMLYACSALIMVRSVFRVIEYVMGTDGYLLSNEWPMYVFDGVLMWAVQVIFFIWCPDSIQLRRGGDDEDGHVLVGSESSMG